MSPRPPSSRTRHEFNVPIENYIKAIWTLSQQKERADEPVKNSEIAEYLCVTRPSVTGMIQKLKRLKLLRVGSETGIRLSPAGKRLAVSVLRKHRLVEMFLQHTLGLEGLELHEEAERMEHAVSIKLLERMDHFLGHPVRDLSGMAIPHLEDLHHRDFESHTPTLMSLEVGQEAEIVSVADYDPALVHRAFEQGLKVGLRFRVMDKTHQEFIQVRSASGTLITLGARQAALLKVRLFKKRSTK